MPGGIQDNSAGYERGNVIPLISRYFAIPLFVLSFAFFLIIGVESNPVSSAQLPMGSDSDISYAEDLWQAMENTGLVGANAKPLNLFYGGAKPHGMILEVASQDLRVGDHTGFVVVKKNYDGEGVTEIAVASDRAKFLSAITVMYQREAGYDSDNQNWFWIKYKPDGALFMMGVNDKSVAMAGRIFKGETREQNRGCLYCHSSAGGGDYIFYPDIKNH